MAEEIKNQGQQENAENLNENVSGQAKEIISAALEETQNRETSPVLKADSNVTDKFSKLHLMVKAAIKRVYWNSMSKDRYSRMEK